MSDTTNSIAAPHTAPPHQIPPDSTITAAAPAVAPAAAAAAAAAPPNWFGRNVYIRNLPPVNPLTFEMPSERHVQALFSRFGTIERLRVIRDRVTSFPVGHALILFTTAESAQAAIHFINNNFHGMTLWPSFNKPSATLWLPKEVFA